MRCSRPQKGMAAAEDPAVRRVAVVLAMAAVQVVPLLAPTAEVPVARAAAAPAED